MAGALWTPVAESDLDDILFYIAFIDRRPATGERLFHEIRDSVARYAEQPLAGHEHPRRPTAGDTSSTKAGWFSTIRRPPELKSCASSMPHATYHDSFAIRS
jgi:plasmid stabilization system protein ParE